MSGSTELEIPETGSIDDAAPPPVADEKERPRLPNDDIRMRIAARYEAEQRAGELAYGETLAHEAQERAGVPHEDPPAEVVAAPSPAPAAPVEAPAPVAAPVAPTLREVNIQGQRVQVTEDQLVHLAELGALTNLAMQQAPQGQQQAQQGAPAQQPQQAPRQGQRPLLDREQASGIVQRLAYGSPDDGVAALQDLAASVAAQMQQPQIDVQQIRQAATQDALQHIQLQNDLTTIGNEFPHIFADQDLTRLAAMKLIDIRQRDTALGHQRPPLDQYREAAGIVRDKIAPQPQSGDLGSEPAHQAASPALQSQRLERKRSAPRNPAAVSRAASLGPQEPSAPTGSQIVEQMRRSRGQMSMN